MRHVFATFLEHGCDGSFHVQVGKQLASNDDQVLKACLREIGQEWNTTGSGGKARKNAIGRLKNHVWNFMR